MACGALAGAGERRMDDQRQSEVAEEMPPSYLPEKLDEDPKSASDDAAESEDAGDADDDRKLDADDDREAEKGEKRRSGIRALLETLSIVAVALLVSVIVKTFFMQAFYVPSGSMENTLRPNDRIAVNRMADTADEIHRGDIVVFVDPGNWLPPSVDKSPAWRRALSKSLQTVGLLPEDAGTPLVKRVIGVGGDRVACCTAAGKLRVNGKEITETYLKPGVNPSEISFDVTVPKGKLWVMGDNRSNSRDSRYHIGERNGGFVPVDNVAGRAWAIFYPFSRFGSIDDASKVFAGVP